MAKKFIEYLKRWGRSDKNCIIAIVGEARTGKSLAGKRLIGLLDDKPIIVFTLEKFLEVISNPANSGRWVLFDEFELEASSIRWYEERAKILGEIFQSFGYMKVNVIITMPHLKFVTRIPRSMIHIVILMVRQRFGIPYRIKFNIMGKEFLKTFRDEDDGKKIFLQFPVLSLKEIKEYKALKKEHIEKQMLPKWKDTLKISKIKTERQKARFLDLMPEKAIKPILKIKRIE